MDGPGRDNARSTIIFDLSEVLIAGLVGIEHRLSPLVRQNARQVLTAFGGEALRELCRGHTTEDDYLRAVVARTGWHVGSEELKRHVRANFHWKIGGMRELVHELSGRYELCLYSDHAREWIEYITAIHPFLSVFEKKVYSFETGRTKDEPGAFEEALLRLGRQAEQCVFVDDSDTNVRHARGCGLCALQFFTSGSLRTALYAQGITFA